ncbi:uncharacterized protein [Apostichopus japonicus]|uniref:uncharacterized protein n=1 Tax=Stichopus japonicus TaxID=307972 RepID=UPI003AB187C0
MAILGELRLFQAELEEVEQEVQEIRTRSRISRTFPATGSKEYKRCYLLHPSQNTSEFTTHDEDFEVLFINSYIGKGLFAKKDFEGGTLLLEYCGKLLSDNDAAHLESESPNRSDYLFSFQHKGKFLCIDAYFTTSKARYINDAKETQANTFVKKVEVHGVPRLFIYSKKTIEKGTEIRYDYGNPHAEWRQDKCCDLTTGGGDPLLDENADGESDIDETTNEGEDKCCDSTSGRSDPLFDENADDESDIDETTNEGEGKCCDITSGGGVIPLDESENDESDNDEIAVGGKGIFSTLVPYSDSDSDCSYIIPMPTSQQRRLGSSLWGETSTESSKSPNRKDSAVWRTTATVSIRMIT